MTNGGLLEMNQQGHLDNYGNVQYYLRSIRNILSLRNVNKNNSIIYNSRNVDKFIVINRRPGGHNIIFTAKKYGLYYNNMRNTQGVSMLINVEENRKYYTQRQYQRAKIAIELYQTVGNPSIKYYKRIIKTNTIQFSSHNGRHWHM